MGTKGDCPFGPDAKSVDGSWGLSQIKKSPDQIEKEAVPKKGQSSCLIGVYEDSMG